MVVTLLPGTNNVYRFPVELRAPASLALLFEMAPDYRQASLVAESFGLDEPSLEVEDEADREMAETLSKCDLLVPSVERNAFLTEFLKPDLEAAIEACRKARAADEAADAATEKLVFAQSNGGYWLAPLEERSDYLTEEAARMLLNAYRAYCKVLGVARAIDLARAGVEWTPRDTQADMLALCAASEAIRAIKGK